MFILVTYDVSTTSREGRRRLQFSVFECNVGETDLVRLRHDLLEEINPDEDSLRLYMLGEDPSRRVEHYGQKPSQDFNDILLV